MKQIIILFVALLLLMGSIATATDSTWHNVKNYGAVGNGVTNDSPAIQKAINAAALAGGGVVYFPPGTYRANILIKSKVILEGAGTNITILKSRSNINKSVIQSDNFDKWSGTATFGGNVDFEIRRMTIDGSKSTNLVAGCGIRVYGKRFRLAEIVVQNAREDGIYTEWGGVASYANPSEDQEAWVLNVKTIFNGGNGWSFHGPGDINVNGMISYQNGKWGLSVAHSMHISGFNGYLNPLGAIHVHSAGAIFGSDLHLTTATGHGILIDYGVGASCISDISATGEIGVEVRSVGQVMSGCIQNTTVCGVRINGGSISLTASMINNTGYWFEVIQAGGTNNITVSAQNGTVGTLMPANQGPGPWDMWVIGGVPGNYSGWRFKPPHNIFYIEGYSPVIPATNDTLKH